MSFVEPLVDEPEPLEPDEGAPSGVRLCMSAPPHADDRRARIERLVREHHDFVWRTLKRLGVLDAELDDAVQEVFLNAVRNVDKIEHERGYLFRACGYAAAHSRRTVFRRREVTPDPSFAERRDPAATPEENAEHAQARERLQAILAAMPEEFRAVFVLFELEHLTMIEIAEILAIPRGTVASRLRRAREIFLEHAGDDP